MPNKSERREDPPCGSTSGTPPKRQRVDGGAPSPGAGPCLRCAGCGASEDSRAPLLLFDDPDEDHEAGAGGGKAGREERR